jgi:hypothetical protein
MDIDQRPPQKRATCNSGLLRIRTTDTGCGLISACSDMAAGAFAGYRRRELFAIDFTAVG